MMVHGWLIDGFIIGWRDDDQRCWPTDHCQQSIEMIYIYIYHPTCISVSLVSQKLMKSSSPPKSKFLRQKTIKKQTNTTQLKVFDIQKPPHSWVLINKHPSKNRKTPPKPWFLTQTKINPAWLNLAPQTRNPIHSHKNLIFFTIKRLKLARCLTRHWETSISRLAAYRIRHVTRETLPDLPPSSAWGMKNLRLIQPERNASDTAETHRWLQPWPVDHGDHWFMVVSLIHGAFIMIKTIDSLHGEWSNMVKPSAIWLKAMVLLRVSFEPWSTWWFRLVQKVIRSHPMSTWQWEPTAMMKPWTIKYGDFSAI